MHQSIKECDHLNQKSDQLRKLIRIKSVINLTGLSKSYIYELCKKGLFPKSIQLVPGGTSVAWVESEVRDWIESRIKSREAEEKTQSLIQQ